MTVRHLATVRVRVTLAAVVVVALALIAGGAWLVRAQRNALTDDVETTARLRARDVAATVASGELAGSLAAPRGDDNLVQVVDSDGNIVAASSNIGYDVRISHLEPGRSGYAAGSVDRLPGGDAPFRVVAQRVTTKKGTFIVYAAGSLDPVQKTADNLYGSLLIGLPILLLLVGVTTWIVTGRALHPVEAMRAEVEAIGAEDLSRRVPEPRTGDEIGRLAHTMNAMLDRLEGATSRQRRFVADASHELRSPLTGIRAQLEVDLAHPERADWQATDREVLEDTIRLQRLIDDLLAVARADGIPELSHRETVDLDEIVLSEARRIRARSELHVDTSGVSGAQLDGNPDELGRAVRNLLDNAARHARSTISVSLGETANAVRLAVTDDGPGIPADQRERIFERFTRLDNARARDTGGAGLGLAITHDIVAAHGGSISLDNVPGARFTVEFPVADGVAEPVEASTT
ncbi:MAG TPA: ATP-binding protein [Acidimicrobiia bacterium]|nr:ATP-binding protein [Acidimicrobiia bacterium]